jgi:N-acyl homoserine lactone hydrolase
MSPIRLALSAFTFAASTLLLASCASAPASTATASVQRLYVIDCGENRTNDLSPWTTPADKGRPYNFSNHCYLVKHAKGWMLWDSGHPDSYAAIPEGVPNLRRTSLAVMHKPLVQSLREIGVGPKDIAYFAMSHSHADHTGNANLFAHATIFMQTAEYDAAFGSEPQRYGYNSATYAQLRDAQIVKLNGDHDVFGDGSVIIKSTAGHTPGHQSLFVRLPKSAPVLMSGDMVHLQANWDARRAPSINFDKDRTVQSMDRMRAFMQQTGARLWINHDAEQARTMVMSPAYVE